MPYNAHAEYARRKLVEDDLEKKNFKIKKLNRKANFLKRKLYNDDKRLEEERKVRRKDQLQQLSDRHVMHFQRKNMYKSIIGMNRNDDGSANIPSETLAKYGLDDNNADLTFDNDDEKDDDDNN